MFVFPITCKIDQHLLLFWHNLRHGECIILLINGGVWISWFNWGLCSCCWSLDPTSFLDLACTREICVSAIQPDSNMTCLGSAVAFTEVVRLFGIDSLQFGSIVTCLLLLDEFSGSLLLQHGDLLLHLLHGLLGRRMFHQLLLGDVALQSAIIVVQFIEFGNSGLMIFETRLRILVVVHDIIGITSKDSKIGYSTYECFAGQ